MQSKKSTDNCHRSTRFPVARLILGCLLVIATGYSQQLNPIDPAFRISPTLSAVPTNLAIDSADRVIAAGGDFVEIVNGHAQRSIARFKADGTLDQTFDCGSGFDAGGGGSIHVEADGKIVIIGTFISFNGVAQTGVLRLAANGAIDSTFVCPSLTTYAFDSKDRIYAVQGATLVRYTATGSVDPTFTSYAIDGTVLALIADTNDLPVCAIGKSTTEHLPYHGDTNTTATLNIVRLKETGGDDLKALIWWNTVFDNIYYFPRAQLLRGEGGTFYLTYAAPFDRPDIGVHSPVLKFLVDGSLDPSFPVKLYGRMHGCPVKRLNGLRNSSISND